MKLYNTFNTFKNIPEVFRQCSMKSLFLPFDMRRLRLREKVDSPVHFEWLVNLTWTWTFQKYSV